MADKSVRDIPGVGPVKEAELVACGVPTVSDAIKLPSLVWAHDSTSHKKTAKSIIAACLGEAVNRHKHSEQQEK